MPPNKNISLWDEGKIQYKVNLELLDIQYKTISFSLLCHFLVLLIIIPIFYGRVDIKRIIIWCICLFIADIICYYFLTVYQDTAKTNLNIKPWKIKYLLSVVFIAAVWGSLGFYLMEPGDIIIQFFIIFLIFALSTAFSQGTIVDITCCRLSILIILSPLTLWCFLQASGIYHSMAILLIIYMAFLFFVTTQGHNLLKQSLVLRYKNIALSEELEKENGILEQKVVERTEELNAAKAEAEAANRAKTEFLGIVSHELRTPLRVIESAAGGLKKYVPKLMEGYHISKKAGLPAAEISEEEYQTLLAVLKNIEQEADASFCFIKMLLNNLSRVNDVSAKNIQCSMVKCIELALERYPFINDESKLIECKNDVNFNFFGNEVLMIHVLFNLMKNALNHIHGKGKGKIHIWLSTSSKNNYLHFRDTAGGISEEALIYVFEGDYFKTDGDTGLELAFCRMIITSFGGTISCHANENEYTEFVLEFPK